MLLLMLLKLLVLFLTTTPPVIGDDPALNDELLALLVFKGNIMDPQDRLLSWNENDDTPCNNWTGVKCNPQNFRVVHLALDGFSLSGGISKSLLKLQYLRNLSLSQNNFTGKIHPSLLHFNYLQSIDLSDNHLSGSIPNELFQQCGSLRKVSFSNNHLSGPIPQSLSSCSTTLLRVNLSSNLLSGTLPSLIWSLTQLRSLDLSGNSLNGEIPRGIGNLSSLRVVSLSNNNLSGQLVDDIGDCLLLKSIDFSGNALSGNLPASLERLSACTSLKLSGNSFTGTVPESIGGMTRLVTLDLSANIFSGQIPNSLGNLQVLRDLNLSRNMLSGSINPATSYQGLHALDLSSNALSGEIPPMISGFSSLLSINLSRNFLNGSIPASMGNLNTTVVVDLSRNRLNGSIPHEIGGAISLKELRLDHNSLSGKIPAQFENCSSLTTLILSDNKLGGSIPQAIASLINLQIVDFSSNNLSGSLPKELANLPLLLVFNVSLNNLCGALPPSGFFNTIPPSAISGNRYLCGAVVKVPCHSDAIPKPIVLNPNFSSDSSHGNSSSPHHKRILLSISTLIAIGAAVCIALGVAAITVLNIHARSAMLRSAAAASAAVTLSRGDEFSCSPTTDANYGKLYMFSGDADFGAGAHALLNKDCELGRGGFGAVYQSTLQDGRSVAIKKLTVSSLVKSQEAFEREVKQLGKIRHPNLVNLEGYYWTPSLQLIIYECISDGSLYKHLHDEAGENCLSWRKRFNIVLGMAKGLAHLHQLNIIHYNLKSTNVLIDSSGEPKVGDFGLARLLPVLDHFVLSSKIQSALGYMAPEFACRTVKITEKCDVYSFGILALEVVTGKKPVEYMEDDVVVLYDMVRGSLEGGKIEERVDCRLCGNFPADEAIPLIKLGLICASQVSSNRPDMGEVVNILELIQCPS